MSTIKSKRFLVHEVCPFPPRHKPTQDGGKPPAKFYTAYTVWSVLIVSFIAGGIIGGLAVFFLIAHLNGQAVDSSLPLPTHKAPAIDTRLPDTTPEPLLT